MSEKSAIEWTDATWNPIRARNRATGKVGWFCEHASPLCDNCYAEKMNVNTYFGNGLPYKASSLPQLELFLDEKMLRKPLGWRKPQKVFVCSMTDLFGRFVPDEWIDRIFAVMALAHQHTFQLLTKRPERARDYINSLSKEKCRGYWFGEIGYLSDVAISNGIATKEEVHARFESWRREHRPDLPEEPQCIGDTVAYKPDFPLSNVWLGTSVGNQDEANKSIPLLLQTPAAVRFISAEPLLGPIDLSACLPKPIMFANMGGFRESITCGSTRPKLHWVIVGGESGPQARPCDISNVRSIVEQCKAAGVACFVKQLGAKPYETRPAEGQPQGVEHALANLGNDHPQRRWFTDWTLVHSGDASAWYRYMKPTDRKGGNIEEFPEDLRVRDFPR